MRSIVIDLDKVVKPNKERLNKFLSAVNFSKNETHNGLVLVLNSNDIDSASEKLDYLNSEALINNILSYCYFDYDDKNGICKLKPVDKRYIENVVKELELSFPKKNVTLLLKVPKHEREEMSELINKGFSNPHYCSEHEVCFLKNKSGRNKELVRDELLYLFKQSDKPKCNIQVFFERECASYLKSLTLGAKTKNADGSVTQKEVFGVFEIEKSKRTSDGDVVYCLDVDKSQNTIGGEEDVSGVVAIFNFHSHPKEAYERNEVDFGWPSVPDFIGYLDMALKGKTVFHCVISLEGIYVLSLLINTAPSGIIKKIQKDYNVYDNAPKVDSPEKFVKYIQSIPGNIFGVQFFKWADIMNKKIISVNFNKEGQNCFINDDTLKAAKKIN